MAYRTSPDPENTRMPTGIPHIIGNEAAERFSFYGMRAILVVFMTKYLWLMNGEPGTAMGRAEANEYAHLFMMAVYFTPLLGGFISDRYFGKYRTIVALSLVYCAGHAALAFMGIRGEAAFWLVGGLALISLGSGGIKPCVSAHVGDQFGKSNSHLLTTVFNWFYFSINFGAFASTLLTPWLLEWYGPHLAFGIPGVLMALATLIFWAGRKRFIHVPPAGPGFLHELRSREGLVAVCKLGSLFLFVSVFWALFDQHGTSWIFQAQDMDRHFLGIDWLESQIGAINPILILTFVPLFTLLIYPQLGKLIKLTPLRKIGAGLFLTAASFAIVSIVQEWIDAGERPNIIWQLLAFTVLTASEVLVSIVTLEFAYTQAPRALKSMIMALYLLAVSFGNFIAAQVNHTIQIDSPATTAVATTDGQPLPATHPGFDAESGTVDDLRFEEDGTISSAASPSLTQAATTIKELTLANNGSFPTNEAGRKAVTDLTDPWGNPLRYQLQNSLTARISSDGPDKTEKTPWDLGILLTLPNPEPEESESWTDSLHPEVTWLDQRKTALGISEPSTDPNDADPITLEHFAGGQVKLEGAAYFWFFTWLMLGTAIFFVPFAVLYKPRTYLQE